jgi:hypothetical protein
LPLSDYFVSDGREVRSAQLRSVRPLRLQANQLFWMQPILNSLSNDKFDYLATNGGQLQPSGSMIDPEERGKTAGRALAIVSILDDVSNYQLPAGSTAQVATYTEYWHHFAKKAG